MPSAKPSPQAAAAAVAAYFADAPQPQRQTLLSMWDTLQALLPAAQPVISYGVPTLKLKGKGVAGLAWYPNHCSYLPMSGSVTATLADALGEYRTTKGAVQFPVAQPLPTEVVTLLVDARLAELGLSR